MKFKKLASALLLTIASASSFAMSDGQAALLGIVIGSHMNQRPVYVQPAPVYIQRPIIIEQPREQYYDSNLHGYCAPYHDEQYAQCMGNIKRHKMEDAYRRGLYGY